MKRRRQNLSGGTLETTLKVDAENVPALQSLAAAAHGANFVVPDADADGEVEIDIEVDYGIDGADPSVGINSATATVNAVTAVDAKGNRLDISDADFVNRDQYDDECLQHAADEDEAAYDRACDDEYERWKDRE